MDERTTTDLVYDRLQSEQVRPDRTEVSRHGVDGDGGVGALGAGCRRIISHRSVSGSRRGLGAGLGKWADEAGGMRDWDGGGGGGG